ncbi:MAG: hypothetical protein K6G27_11775 [Lachnospiraceae bacterium]|nr:hypothetical protein [Lachnospiraceae bacterium]
MTYIVMIALGVLVNFIIYLSFGSLITMGIGKKHRGSSCPILLSAVIGFFLYYCVFFAVCLPPMKYYRPLSMLTKIWVPTVLVVVAASLLLNGKAWIKGFGKWVDRIRNKPALVLLIIIPVIIQVVLVSCTYNFTLDAAYYVANVATSVETDMMNVYDPFTGAWQDHYEMRYFFATYQIQDAVVCQLTGIPALIWTKSVMAVTVIILTNIVYYMIAGEMFMHVPFISGPGDEEAETKSGYSHVGYVRNNEFAIPVMMIFMLVVNLTFITIYTSSLFLLTRTYEGKAIVGNLAIITVFYLFIRMNDESIQERAWLITFIVCFGAATISSSANMLLPVELTVLFIPIIIRKKSFSMLPKYIACVIPGVVFSLIFVLYVKGYFVWYTFPK